MENIKIGAELYHVSLDSFVMVDQTKKVEARVNKVTILGTFEFVNEEARYVFKIGPAQLEGGARDFHETKTEAMVAARTMLSAISIRDMEEEERVVEEKRKADASAAMGKNKTTAEGTAMGPNPEGKVAADTEEVSEDSVPERTHNSV